MLRKDFWKILKKAFFPDDVTCYYCGRELREKHKYCLCDKCRAEVKAIDSEFTQIESLRALIVCEYEGLSRNLVLDEKDGGRPYLTRVVAEYLAEKIKNANVEYDFLAYVPSSGRNACCAGTTI